MAAAAVEGMLAITTSSPLLCLHGIPKQSQLVSSEAQMPPVVEYKVCSMNPPPVQSGYTVTLEALEARIREAIDALKKDMASKPKKAIKHRGHATSGYSYRYEVTYDPNKLRSPGCWNL
ncbi:hypothetical protein EX30DRAFT_338990 [Ascodesmis nigricans]|uniref:Uncharacterized protein n=1 Tax=Ascodesmis nigricans TaxID=341454 RepID=A0A4V3SJ54_9PEZI|nr:hypothetical protein EX30DRAFT_338990 [Ascodesmis nigricans]